MTNRDNLEIKRFISDISDLKGEGTELVSVYIPPDKNISDVRQHLISEENEAGNIKSKKTRNNVQDALSSLASSLKKYNKTPDNGMVLFCGMINGEKQKYVLDNLPEPVNSFEYHCNSKFLTEPLENLVSTDKRYGLIALDLNNAKIGWLKGTNITEEWSEESMIHGKHSAGGQSQARFERVREKQINNYFNKIADKAKSIFYDKRHEINGVLIGGTSHTVEKFLNSGKLHHELEDIIKGKVNVTNVKEKGLEELVNNSQEILKNSKIIEKKKLVDKFYSKLRDDMAEYGFDNVVKMTEYGATEKILLSDEVRGKVNEYSEEYDSEENILDFLETKARNTGAEVEVIPSNFEEGEQFYDSLTGIGAILRYNPKK